MTPLNKYRRSDGDMGYHGPDNMPDFHGVNPRLYPPHIASPARLAALDHAAKASRRWEAFKEKLEMLAAVGIVALVIYVLVLL